MSQVSDRKSEFLTRLHGVASNWRTEPKALQALLDYLDTIEGIASPVVNQEHAAAVRKDLMSWLATASKSRD